MAYTTLTYAVSGGIARVTLDRPAQFNALDLTMAEELLDVANRCGTDATVRVAVLTGAGDRAFCAGGDIPGFAAAAEDLPLLIQQMTGALHLAISRLAWMRAPLIAAVNGVAAGAGLSLVACCDLAIAADTARFTSAYTQIGLTPDGSSSWFLPRLIGVRRAAELYLTNRVLSASEAAEWGLVNRVVPAAELAAAVTALAENLAAGPTEAFGGVKRLLRTTTTESLETQMERETRQIVAAATSADGREGITAFLAKRKPHFRGT